LLLGESEEEPALLGEEERPAALFVDKTAPLGEYTVTDFKSLEIGEGVRVVFADRSLCSDGCV